MLSPRRKAPHRAACRPLQALADAQLAQKLRPGDARGLVAEGIVRMATRDFKLAKKAFKGAMRLDPDYPGACACICVWGVEAGEERRGGDERGWAGGHPMGTGSVGGHAPCCGACGC